MLAVGVCNLPETYFLLIFLGVYEVGCFWEEGRINQLRDCTLKVPHKVFFFHPRLSATPSEISALPVRKGVRHSLIYPLLHP